MILWIEIGLLVLVAVVIVTSLVEWPGQNNQERIKQIAILTVACETLINSANDAINRLRLLVDDDRDVDTAVADLIWARDYVMKRTESYDLQVKDYGGWNSGSMGYETGLGISKPELQGYETGASWMLNQNRKHDAGYTEDDMKLNLNHLYGVDDDS